MNIEWWNANAGLMGFGMTNIGSIHCRQYIALLRLLSTKRKENGYCNHTANADQT